MKAEAEPTQLDTVHLVVDLMSRDGVALVPAEESGSILGTVAELLDLPDARRMQRWWWSGARRPFFTVAYGNAPELAPATWSVLTHGEDDILLTVTDNYAPPWRTFAGRPNVVFAAIENAPHTEFFVTSQSGAWVAFDTHHNCIMLAGWCGKP